MKATPIIINGKSLTMEEVVRVARYFEQLHISEESCRKVQHTRKYVEKLLQEKKVVYGLTTGFGKFSDTYISYEDTKAAAAELNTKPLLRNWGAIPRGSGQSHPAVKNQCSMPRLFRHSLGSHTIDGRYA